MRNVLLLTEVGSTGALTCKLIATFVGTFVAFEGGLVVITRGTARDGPAPVVKCFVCAGTLLAAISFTPATVSVICVDAGSTPCGVICTSWLLLLKVIEPGVIVWPPPVTWMVVPFTVVGSIAPLN